jgi:Fe-S cluster biogenesis protein NfuA
MPAGIVRLTRVEAVDEKNILDFSGSCEACDWCEGSTCEGGHCEWEG